MKYVVTGIFILFTFVGYAQNDYLKFTDYSVAQPLINPATMGLESGANGLLIYQTCFETTNARPSLGAFNINSLLSNKNLGGGLSILYDKFGPYQKISAYIAASYKMKVNEGKFLYFGLQAGVNYVENDPMKYTAKDKQEVNLLEKVSLSQPNFGFGMHYVTEKFYLGFAIPEFMYNYIDYVNNEKQSGFVAEKLRFYVYGSYKFPLSKNIQLEPYTYLTYADAKAQLDLGGRLWYREVFCVGLQYRTNESIGVMARVKLFDELWLGYSFENNPQASPYFNSLQEISLSFHFGKKSKKSSTSNEDSFEDNINSIRYF